MYWNYFTLKKKSLTYFTWREKKKKKKKEKINTGLFFSAGR